MKQILKLAVFLPMVCMILVSCKKVATDSPNPTYNKPPIANAGADQIAVLPKDSVSLDGSASSDPDGTITSYKWIKISGPASSNILQSDSSKTLVKTLVMGVYKFELTVKDHGGLSAKDTVQIIVNDLGQPNRPPVANAGPDQAITLPINSVTIDGSASIDPDNNITSYAWTKISGPSFNIANGNTVQTQVTNLVQGIYQIELRVTDAGGLFSKDTIQVSVNAATVIPPCDNRPIINANLVQIGTLSESRFQLVSATVNNKILFAGGQSATGYSSRVDLYDITTNTWSTAELSSGDRLGMATATVGNKVLFAGGMENDNGIQTSRVDIYDATTNSWSQAELSKARAHLAAATLGNKVFFAGGAYWNYYLYGSSVVDIYDNATNTWSTTNLSEGRQGLSATTAGNKIYFAGGSQGPFLRNISTRIDIFDGATNSWATSNLQEGKSFMASFAVAGKVYWAGGLNSATLGSSGWNLTLSNQAEVRDINTGASSFACMIPRYAFSAVQKDDNIIFFTGDENNSAGGTHFEIYNLTTNTWSTGVLNQKITDATIISVYNIIYVAGGHVNDVLSNKVWRLEF